MKNILIYIITFYIFPLAAQEDIKYFVNNVPLDSIDTEYVEIIGSTKFFSTKLNIQLDFGQFNSIWKGSDTRLTNSLGKNVELNSMIEALNFMIKNGYEYVDSFVISNPSVIIYHYKLRKLRNKAG